MQSRNMEILKTYYTVSQKNDTALACYNFDMHQPILILFGRNVAKKVRSQMVLYLSASPN